MGNTLKSRFGLRFFDGGGGSGGSGASMAFRFLLPFCFSEAADMLAAQ